MGELKNIAGMVDKIDFDCLTPTKEKPICVVKLSTSWYYSSGALTQKRSLRVLRRQSTADFVSEEVSNSDAEDTWKFVENINECNDGVYYLNYVGSCDWEGEWSGVLRLSAREPG